MNVHFSKFAVQALLGCTIISIAVPALADSTWSNLGSGGASPCASTASSGVPLGNVLNCGTQSGVVLNTDAFSTNTATGTTFAAASLYNWGSGYGLGVVNVNEAPGTTGPHAADNISGIDAVRLSFSSAVTLKSVKLGWNGTDNSTTNTTGTYNDSDISVLAWTGPGAPGAVTGTTIGGAGNGWTLVGNYADVGAAVGNTATVSSAIYSSYWLISAYSTAFGTGVGLSAGNDAFKLLGVSASTKSGGSVPEPGSIALIGAGLLGLFVRARRKIRKGF